MSLNELISDDNINDDSRKLIEEIQSQIIEEKKKEYKLKQTKKLNNSKKIRIQSKKKKSN